MGQRNQLFWDLPAIETFRVNQAIYRIGERAFRSNLDELVGLLALEPLLTKQVRTLSLGERMRCELAAGLLHRPDVLFLDEPTLGLDVRGQAADREFLTEYNQRHSATVLLTSHYMADVTSLAKRVVLIDHGVLGYDGDLVALIERVAPFRLLKVSLSEPVSLVSVTAARPIIAGMVKIAMASPTERWVPASAPTATGVMRKATRMPAVIPPSPAPRRPGSRAASS